MYMINSNLNGVLLRLCYEEACEEIQKVPEQDYCEYAIYPRYIIEYVKSLNVSKDIDFCFLGAFSFRRGQQIGYNNRRWILDFCRDKFTEDSYFVNTTKHKGLSESWTVLGSYDHTFDPKVDFKAPKYMENKNYFDKSYYQVMKRSKFCLCPAGDLMWSMRFYEALLCKCIPIVDRFEESYRNEEEAKIPYKFYYANEEKFIYHQDWVDSNYQLFLKYHSFVEKSV